MRMSRFQTLSKILTVCLLGQCIFSPRQLSAYSVSEPLSLSRISRSPACYVAGGLIAIGVCALAYLLWPRESPLDPEKRECATAQKSVDSGQKFVLYKPLKDGGETIRNIVEDAAEMLYFCGKKDAWDGFVTYEFPREDLTWLLLQENGVAKGFVAYFVKEQGNLGTILYLAVDSSFRGKGLGTRLLKAGMDALTSDHGCSQIDLEVHKENLAAQKLYARFGFKDSGSSIYACAKRMVKAL
ncbi:MAG: GNAT family N-acetyltransferase [Candidatus Dependentiae bacterium]|nr:GNAT family N-acetyltransferase [Candidatus Dependentiae bacterium]